MRLLVLSDVHSNLPALEACLAAAPAHDAAVNLGDVVGYGANPNEVVERLRRECCLHVRGNHDRVCSGLTDPDGFNPLAALAAYWTRKALTPETLQWLRTLPRGPLRMDGLDRTQFVHGSPADEDEYLLSVVDALHNLLRCNVPFTFYGHTHIQGGFVLHQDRGSEIQPSIDAGDSFANSELRLKRNARYLINPGSVGQPRDGDWRSAFALYDSETSVIRFYRVPYDVKEAQQRIFDARLPEHLAVRLSVGR